MKKVLIWGFQGAEFRTSPTYSSVWVHANLPVFETVPCSRCSLFWVALLKLLIPSSLRCWKTWQLASHICVSPSLILSILQPSNKSCSAQSIAPGLFLRSENFPGLNNHFWKNWSFFKERRFRDLR